MKIHIQKSEDILFKLLIITSVLAYGVHALYLIIHRSYALWTISSSEVNVGILGSITPYLKDIILLFLFCVLYVRYRKSRIVGNTFFALIIVGGILLVVNGTYDIRYCIAGIRMYLYVFTAIMWCESCIDYECNIREIHKIICLLSVVEFILVFLQVFNSGVVAAFGQGGWRFCGSFGNAGGLGCFAFASSMYILVADSVFTGNRKIWDFVLIVMNLLVSVASGMRAAMLLCIFIVFIYVINYIGIWFQLWGMKKWLLFFTMGIVGAPIAYRFVLGRANRGALMVSGGTRVGVLIDLFQVDDLFGLLQLLIGRGIGDGTNNLINLGLASAEIMDGTVNTTISQFGVIGLGILLCWAVKVFANCFRYSKNIPVVAFAFCVGCVVISLTGNIFEQISLILILAYCFYLLKYQYKKGKRIR